MSETTQGDAGGEVGGTLLLRFNIKPELFGATSINLIELTEFIKRYFTRFFPLQAFLFEENMKGKVGSFFPLETNILYENIISFKLLTRHGIYSGINS